MDKNKKYPDRNYRKRLQTMYINILLASKFGRDNWKDGAWNICQVQPEIGPRSLDCRSTANQDYLCYNTNFGIFSTWNKMQTSK